MNEIVFDILPEMEDMRIDKCISDYMDNLSRSYIQKIIKDGNVYVNDIVIKANYRVKFEDKVRFIIPDSVEPNIPAQNIPLDILYEDTDILIINKSKNMVVHPAPGHYEGTLVNAIMYHCKDNLSGINGVMRPGIVHRIDKDTTGSVIVCKNDEAHTAIAELLKTHDITRKYRAIVYGIMKEEHGTVDAPIGRHPNDRKKMAVNIKNGKRAVTHYQVLEHFGQYTYIECQLETGRTHQIRVHMASIGHPLLGDAVYSNRKAPFRLEGQVLHAMTLGFIHPRSGEYVEFVAPLPEYFEKLLSVLRNKTL
ncbi:MAG: RluA family pseudouridine synthase [Lachnospiraceae bacterium]|nr:RluA family pseudouridine synthase [Lachnospiraceae bacterium]